MKSPTRFFSAIVAVMAVAALPRALGAQEALDPENAKIIVSWKGSAERCRVSIREIARYDGTLGHRYICIDVKPLNRTDDTELLMTDLPRFLEEDRILFQYGGNSVESLLRTFATWKNWMLTEHAGKYHVSDRAAYIERNRPYSIGFVSRQGDMVTLRLTHEGSGEAISFPVRMNTPSSGQASSGSDR